jgi:hypothetical protein
MAASCLRSCSLSFARWAQNGQCLNARTALTTSFDVSQDEVGLVRREALDAGHRAIGGVVFHERFSRFNW